MTFVFSYWYIVMAVLLVGIVAAIVAFILMDKKDKVIIKEFVDSIEQQKPEERQQVVSETEEPAKE